MKVSEVIAALRLRNQDAEVWLVVGGDGADHIDRAERVVSDNGRIIIEAEGIG